MIRTLFGVLQNMPKMRVDVASCPGSPVKDKFIMEVTSKGYPSLRKTGEHNVYDEIQSYREGCDLSAILQSFGNECPRFNPLGFEEAEGFVNDFSDVSSLGDLVNDGEAVKQFFNELPLEVRNCFDNSVHKFARDFTSEGFLDSLRKAFNVPPDPVPTPDPPSSVESSIDGGGADSDPSTA
jgi:hypothetical protein